MKTGTWLLLALLLSIAATAGSDIFARIDISGESLAHASSEHARMALKYWFSTMLMLAPFLIVGWISAVVDKRGRRSVAIPIFVAGAAALTYLYFGGHQDGQRFLEEGKWTAAALSIGALPLVGILVVLFVGLVAALSVGWRPED